MALAAPTGQLQWCVCVCVSLSADTSAQTFTPVLVQYSSHNHSSFNTTECNDCFED